MKTYTYRGKSTNTLYTLTLTATNKQDDYGRELVAYTLRENDHAPAVTGEIHAIGESEGIASAWFVIYSESGLRFPGYETRQLEALKVQTELETWAAELHAELDIIRREDLDKFLHKTGV